MEFSIKTKAHGPKSFRINENACNACGSHAYLFAWSDASNDWKQVFDRDGNALSARPETLEKVARKAWASELAALREYGQA